MVGKHSWIVCTPFTAKLSSNARRPCFGLYLFFTSIRISVKANVITKNVSVIGQFSFQTIQLVKSCHKLIICCFHYYVLFACLELENKV